MRPIATDVWQLERGEVRMPAGVRMPLSSTLIRLPDRSLLLYSPATFDDAAAAEIDAAGEVAHLVAPSLLHHLHAGTAAARWPRALLHGAPGLAAKRPDLVIHRELGGEIDPAWRDVLDVEVIRGAPKLNETVLFHRPTGTLLCADLVFNVTRPANLVTRLVLAIVGAGGRRLGQSREWLRLARDRVAIRASIDRILSWPITHVVPAHGDPVAIDAAGLAPLLTRAYRGRVAAPRAALASSASSQ
jgi:hypothetical protein